MASPDLASRRWIWEQYDSQVGADTVQRPGGDAAVVRVHGTNKALAMTTDCTPRYCYADPYRRRQAGDRRSLSQPLRGRRAGRSRSPTASTSATRSGPRSWRQIVGCLEGMGEACRALDFPIVSGNVSLYNESKATRRRQRDPADPRDRRRRAARRLGEERDDRVQGGGRGHHRHWRLDTRRPHLGQSLWLREIHGRRDGPPPPVDLDDERKAGEFIRKLIADGLVTAVHDVSDGGAAGRGRRNGACRRHWERSSIYDRDDRELDCAFGEDQGRYVVTASDEARRSCRRSSSRSRCLLASSAAPAADRTGSTDSTRGNECEVPLADLRAAHEGFFPALMGADAALA